MTNPPDDEELRIVPDKKPRPRLIEGGIRASEQPVSAEPAAEHSSSISLRRVAVTIGVVLALIALAAGIMYWKERQRYPVVVTIALPDTSEQGDPLAGKLGPLVPVKPDLLQVTAIALGEPRLTVVNGKQLAEGEWLVVTTSLGLASLRVISIQDGLVRFKHGGEMIDVRLQAAEKTPH